MNAYILPIIFTIVTIVAFYFASRTDRLPRIFLIALGVVFGLASVYTWFQVA